MVPKECGLPASCFSYLGSCVHWKHRHACNRITECAVRGFLVCIQTETFVFLLWQGSTDLPLEATRDIFHAGITLVCIQTENFLFLLWQGSTDSPLEATRDIFHVGMMQRNKSVYAWWRYCHPFVLHHSGRYPCVQYQYHT